MISFIFITNGLSHLIIIFYLLVLLSLYSLSRSSCLIYSYPRSLTYLDPLYSTSPSSNSIITDSINYYTLMLHLIDPFMPIYTSIITYSIAISMNLFESTAFSTKSLVSTSISIFITHITFSH